jgi:response regulator RpfG family c-di-GMP phosphodiesterase
MIRERRGQQFDPRVVDAFAIVDRLFLAREAINAAEDGRDESDADPHF